MWKHARDVDPGEHIGKWPQLRFDQIRGIENMEVSTLDLFNKMVTDAQFDNDWTYRINSSYRKSDPKYHGKGQALDFVFFDAHGHGVPVVDQYNFAKKYPWGGIGLYPRWTTPGLHCDLREGWHHVAKWWRDKITDINGRVTKPYRGVGEYEEVFGVKLT